VQGEGSPRIHNESRPSVVLRLATDNTTDNKWECIRRVPGNHLVFCCLTRNPLGMAMTSTIYRLPHANVQGLADLTFATFWKGGPQRIHFRSWDSNICIVYGIGSSLLPTSMHAVASFHPFISLTLLIS